MTGSRITITSSAEQETSLVTRMVAEIEDESVRILRRYGVLCSTAAESNARAKALARMGEFTAREREILFAAGWLR